MKSPGQVPTSPGLRVSSRENTRCEPPGISRAVKLRPTRPKVHRKRRQATGCCEFPFHLYIGAVGLHHAACPLRRTLTRESEAARSKTDSEFGQRTDRTLPRASVSRGPETSAWAGSIRSAGICEWFDPLDRNLSSGAKAELRSIRSIISYCITR